MNNNRSLHPLRARSSLAFPTMTAWNCFLVCSVLFVLLGGIPETFAQSVNVFGQAGASTAGLDSGTRDVAIIVYRVLKIVAVLCGGIGVWRLLDYKWAVGCFACFCFLFFMPTLVELAQTIGQASFNATQQHS
jgi:hypothetical protein